MVAVPVAKRYGPVIAAAAAAGVIGYLAGRRNRTVVAPTPSAELQALLTRLLA